MTTAWWETRAFGAQAVHRFRPVHLPRKLLLPLAIALTGLAYYLVLFTDWPSYYHGGGPLHTVIADVVVVLGAFSCWELFRTERIVQVRAVAAAVGFPLTLVALAMLWYGLRRHAVF